MANLTGPHPICVCEECGTAFYAQYRRKRFCSTKCSRKKYYHLNYTPSTQEHLGRSTVGTISELRVAVDLLEKGYEVFRALSQHASCDLAILKDNKLLRVEVRTGRPSKNRKSPFWPKTKKERSDVFAVVLESIIIYQPDII